MSLSDSQFERIGLTMAGPQTIIAAAVIAPEAGYTKISGTTQVQTITPVYTDRAHLLFITAGATNSFALTTGNITGGVTTSVTTAPTMLLFDPAQQKYVVVP